MQSRLKQNGIFCEKFIEKTERKYKQVPEVVTTISKTNERQFLKRNDVKDQASFIIRIYNEEFDPGSG